MALNLLSIVAPATLACCLDFRFWARLAVAATSGDPAFRYGDASEQREVLVPALAPMAAVDLCAAKDTAAGLRARQATAGVA